MSWENGRLLSSLSLTSFDLSFEYNADGIRTSKTVNGTKHTYQVDGTRIISEAYLDYLFVYLYDAAGSPIGFQVRRTSYAEGVFDTFWYEKNLQGDIIAVYNASGTKLAEYTYDAWGNHTVTYFNSGYMTMAPQNPFRYRGYYYDYETGFYYLNSRYYDPATGRFITADVYISTGQGILGNNMYAYCRNNPVMRYDVGGYLDEEIMDDDPTTPVDNLGPVHTGHGSTQSSSGGGGWSGTSGYSATYSGSGYSLTTGSSWIRGNYHSSPTSSSWIVGNSHSPTASSRSWPNSFSTGRTTPVNITEQIAMKSVQSNPAAGKVIMTNLNDRCLPSGAVKMSQSFNTYRGRIEIHYVHDGVNNIYFDFKFK